MDVALSTIDADGVTFAQNIALGAGHKGIQGQRAAPVSVVSGRMGVRQSAPNQVNDWVFGGGGQRGVFINKRTWPRMSRSSARSRWPVLFQRGYLVYI